MNSMNALSCRDATIDRLDGSPGNEIQLNAFVGHQAFLLARSEEANSGHSIHAQPARRSAWFGTRSTISAAGRLPGEKTQRSILC
jgi:hypothetical protein